MRPDQKWAEEHGMTRREFQFAMLNAQRKIMRGEKLSDMEHRVWRFAMYGDEGNASLKV